MSRYTQANRLFQVTTPFGGETLLFGTMEAVERLSEPFEFVLILPSEQSELDADQILGKPVVVKIAAKDSPPRYFHGLAADFAQINYGNPVSQGLSEYSLTLRPWLWFLSQTADCRWFQNKTVPDIVQEVCRQAGFTDLRLALSGSYAPWEYCVQFRETDLNFVSRLLEQEGIFYYFEHSQSKHVLVLCDDPAQLTTAPGYAGVPFKPVSGQNPMDVRENIFEWFVEKSFRSGAYATRQFEFKIPSPVLSGTSSIARPYNATKFETFDFPALAATPASAAVEHVALLRVQEQQTGQTLARGSGDALGLATGCIFGLEKHPRADLNTRYLIRSTSISMSNGSYVSGDGRSSPEFNISLEAVLAAEPYRPARTTAKPLVHGLQSALVVGPKGSEIYTDQFGRVKVQFHWDRQGKMDENSSCWIRVAHTWAGKGWGAVQIPRIGHEVIVAFMDGDPDRPVIVGSLYNGANQPPYPVPTSATQSGVRSRSSMGGTASNFNEILFEDQKGSEQLSFQAEKDHRLTVKHDSTTKIGNDLTIDVGGTGRACIVGSLEVTSNTSITLSAGLASIKLTQTGAIEIDGTMIKITAGEVMINAGATLNMTAGGAATLTAGGAAAFTVGGAVAITAGAAVEITAAGLANITAAGGIIEGPVLAPP
jgi:type VI secretion system secreted protein VgrG